MKIEEIWISTETHQLEFNKVVQSNNWVRKILGLYKLPVKFPNMRIMWQRFPIVFEKRNSIEIRHDKVLITPLKDKNVSKYRNLDTDYSVKIEISDIQKIERYKNPNPFIKSFEVHWIVIKLESKLNEEGFLMCVGGQSIKQIRKETNKLYEELKKVLQKVREIEKG